MPSTSRTTREMLARKTPPSMAVAAHMAYTPGWMFQDGSHFISSRPQVAPNEPPTCDFDLFRSCASGTCHHTCTVTLLPCLKHAVQMGKLEITRRKCSLQTAKDCLRLSISALVPRSSQNQRENNLNA